MKIGAGGNLRQMSDAEHLMMPGELADFFGDGFSRLTADARIDLVENHCVDLVTASKETLHRQHQPGQLTSGYNPAQRLGRLARICGKEKFNRIPAGTLNSQHTQAFGFRDVDPEHRLGETEGRQLLFHTGRQLDR